MFCGVLGRVPWFLVGFPGSAGGFRFVFLERSKKRNGVISFFWTGQKNEMEILR